MAEETRVVIEGLPEFLRALKRFAPEVRKEFNKQARAVASAIASTAKQNANWSRRIPGAIGTSVTGRGVGVRLSKSKAPHGAMYERGTKGGAGVVRRPLFGNRQFWFSTPTRPFLEPAVEAHREEATESMLEAIEAAKRGVGLE